MFVFEVVKYETSFDANRFFILIDPVARPQTGKRLHKTQINATRDKTKLIQLISVMMLTML